MKERRDGGVCGELGGRGEGEGGHGVVRYFEFRFLAKFRPALDQNGCDNTIIFVDAFGKRSKSYKIGFFGIRARTELANKGVEPSHLKFLLKN